MIESRIPDHYLVLLFHSFLIPFIKKEPFGSLTGSLIITLNRDIEDIDTSLNLVTGTLSLGATSFTISNARITADSILDFYTSIYGVNPLTVTVSTGQVVLTFPSQTVAMTVGVRING